jgi:hypothetical protein
MSTHRWYRLKKAWEIFPGFRQPICARVLEDHYQTVARERSKLRFATDSLIAGAFQLWLHYRVPQIARRYRLSRSWQRRAAAIAHSRFIDPNEIALLDLESPADTEWVIRRYEFSALSRRFNPAAWARDCVLADKARFAERCARMDLPHPTTLAQVKGGKARVFSMADAAELAAKHRAGTGGSGFRLLKPPVVCLQSAEALKHWLETEFDRFGEWIIQDRLTNHPDLTPVTLQALSTTRITTVLNETGEPEIVAALQRYAMLPDALVDNASKGGFISSIDPETGQLSAGRRGRSSGDVHSCHDTHPLTGASIAGRQLPDWQDAKRLVTQAHRDAFTEYTMIGWDVALTPTGPLLLEGNGKPNVLLNLRSMQSQAERDRFGELIALHLDSRQNALDFRANSVYS